MASPFTLRSAAWYLAALTALAGVATLQTLAANAVAGTHVPFLAALSWGAIEWFSLGALAVPLFLLARRMPLHDRPRALVIAGYGVVSFVCAVLTCVLFAALMIANPFLADPAASFRGLAVEFLSQRFSRIVILFWAALSGHYAVTYYRSLRERESQLTRARLAELRRQFQPHFLFNTLSTIAELTRSDPAAAEEMTVQLAALLRTVLEEERELIPLSDEIALARRYLSIMQVRFEDRLHVLWNVDGQAAGTLVPFALLQPLLENAIRHALRTAHGPLTVGLRARGVDGDLELEVSNPVGKTGGFDGGREQVGLRTTRQRLEALFGDKARLATTREADTFRVTIRLPIVEDERCFAL